MAQPVQFPQPIMQQSRPAQGGHIMPLPLPLPIPLPDALTNRPVTSVSPQPQQNAQTSNGYMPGLAGPRMPISSTYSVSFLLTCSIFPRFCLSSIGSFDCIDLSVLDICSIHGPATNEWAHHGPVPASTPDKCALLSCRGTTLVAGYPQHTTCSARASVCRTYHTFCRSSRKNLMVLYTDKCFHSTSYH